MREGERGLMASPGAPPLDLGRHGGDAAQLDVSSQDVLAETRVLGVLQVADAAADSVLVLHVCGLQLLVDAWDP